MIFNFKLFQMPVEADENSSSDDNFEFYDYTEVYCNSDDDKDDEIVHFSLEGLIDDESTGQGMKSA